MSVGATSLSGRSALVTGSVSGLGLAIADALAASGCDIVLHGIEPDTVGGAAAEGVAARHRVAARYVASDLSSLPGVADLLERIRSDGIDPDILVNNAVVRHFAPLESFPVDHWERALAVNLSAPFHLVQSMLPAMRARGFGRIVNLSSVYGSRGTTNRIDYVTTKTALLGFTRAVAMETVGQGVTCNAVVPGSVLTPSIDARVQALARDAGLDAQEAKRQFLVGKQPNGEFIDPTHVAALVVFLCGPAGRDITGASLPVEGGWLAG